MIQLSSKPSVPASLQSDRVNGVLESIRAKLLQGEEVTDKDFDSSIWRNDDVRLSLWEYQHKKCCYCERIRDPKGEPDIEHYRPRTSIEGEGKPGYWWLAYDWENLFFSCKACNNKKRHHFPLHSGKRVREENGCLANELPVIPHPVDEDPADFITFRWENEPDVAVPIGRDYGGRGAKAIRILGIDKLTLNEERGRLLLVLRGVVAKMHGFEHNDNQSKIADTAREIASQTASSSPFAGFARAFFHGNGLGKFVTTGQPKTS